MDCAWHLVDYKSIPPFDLPDGRPAVFDLPSDNPANTMQLFKYVSNYPFGRVRKDDDSLGEELRFERDSNGKVVRLLHNDNFENRLK